MVNFSKPEKLDISYPKGITPWHIDAIKNNKLIELIFVGYDKSDKWRSHMNLYYVKSEDGGKTWSTPKVILTPRKGKYWDNSGLYRSSILKKQDGYIVLYSGLGQRETVGLGLVRGKNIDSLK